MSEQKKGRGKPRRQILTRGDGTTIAYCKSSGRAPGVVFLTGFRSDMTGQKALALEAHCRARGQAFVRFDYTGHGSSSGAFADGTIGQWAADAVSVIDELTRGPQILVGSSLGGWIMLLVGLARPLRIAGLLGIAAAPDFTEDLIWPALGRSQRARLRRTGHIDVPSAHSDEPHPITWSLIEDGRRHLVMRRPIGFSGPVRLLHGLNDADVPWQTALDLQARLGGSDVEVSLIKDGDHRLSRPQDIHLLTRTLDALVDTVAPARAR
jgi:pimeloyl-ACP methyl ester carboxylesterase